MLMYLVYWLVGSYIVGTVLMLTGTYGFKEIKELDKNLHYRLHALLWLLSPLMSPLALVAVVTKVVNVWVSNLAEVVAMLPIKFNEKAVNSFKQKQEAMKAAGFGDFSDKKRGSVTVIKSIEELQEFIKEMQDEYMSDEKPEKEDIRH